MSNRNVLRNYRRIVQTTLRGLKVDLRDTQRKVDALDLELANKTGDVSPGVKQVYRSKRDVLLYRISKIEIRIKSFRSLLSVAEASSLVPKKYKGDKSFGHEPSVVKQLAMG
jgi:hypothetical protein